MGWKASLIIVQHPEPAVPELELLRQLVFGSVKLLGTWTLEEGLYPRDKSLSIGSYNDCLVLADDYQLTDALEATQSPGQLVATRKLLTASACSAI